MGVRPDRQKSDQCGPADLVRNKFFRWRKATAQDIRGSTSGDLVNMVAGQATASGSMPRSQALCGLPRKTLPHDTRSLGFESVRQISEMRSAAPRLYPMLCALLRLSARRDWLILVRVAQTFAICASLIDVTSRSEKIPGMMIRSIAARDH